MRGIIGQWFSDHETPRTTSGSNCSVWLLQLGDERSQPTVPPVQQLREELCGLLAEAMANPVVEADLLVMLQGDTIVEAHWSAEDLAFLAAHRIALQVDYFVAG